MYIVSMKLKNNECESTKRFIINYNYTNLVYINSIDVIQTNNKLITTIIIIMTLEW